MTGRVDPHFSIHRDGDSKQTLASVEDLAAESRAAGLDFVLLTRPHSEAADRAVANRSHDVKAALRTLTFVHKALHEGYRFDDEVAPSKIEALGKAIAVLERESELLCKVLYDS